jgi:hypothetical protein
MKKIHNEGRNKEKCPDHLFCHKMFHVTYIIIHTRNSTAKTCIHVKISYVKAEPNIEGL